MLKKFFFIFFLLTFPLAAQLKFATTIHPFKEIIQRVVGDRGEVIAILKPGYSPHTYEVSPLEVKEVESATALFYGSNDFDGWALKFDNNHRNELISFIPKDLCVTIDSLKNS